LPHFQLEITVGIYNIDAGAGKSIADSAIQFLGAADLANGLQGGGEIGPLACEDRGIGADLRVSRRCVAIGPQMIVKSPVPQRSRRNKSLGASRGSLQWVIMLSNDASC